MKKKARAIDMEQNRKIPLNEIRILLSYILKIRQIDLLFKDFKLSEQQILYLNNLIERRVRGEPIAYLIGETDFYNLTLKVDRNTLIPRPETEECVDFILNRFDNSLNLKVLDIGTGSGAIALSLKNCRPSWDIDACDIDSNTLNVAIQNGKNLGLHVNFFQSDLFENVHGKFDLIASNPPYVSANEIHLLNKDVFFEPQKALFANNDGFQILEKIILQSRSFLNKNGFLFLEHGYNQSEKLQNFLKSEKWKNIKTIKDLQGKNRFTFASLE